MPASVMGKTEERSASNRELISSVLHLLTLRCLWDMLKEFSNRRVDINLQL